MNEVKITPVNFAMQSGIIIGLLGVLKLVLLYVAFDFALIGFFFLLTTIFYHFAVFIFAKRYKNTVLEGEISFFQAWNVSTLIYFFASILTGAVEFAFYKFVNPDFLATYIPRSIKAIQGLANVVEDTSSKAVLNETAVNIAKSGIPTAINMVMANIQNTIFVGLFISLIISAILIRKKKIKKDIV